jgi:hypothetical protein
MSDLLGKLSVLVRARLNSAVDEALAGVRPRAADDDRGPAFEPHSAERERAAYAPGEAGPEGQARTPRAPVPPAVRETLGDLRDRLDAALAYEQRLRRQADVLSDEIARWDADADRAVLARDTRRAAYAQEQMRRAEQRQAQIEQNIAQHMAAAQAVYEQVEVLEAALNARDTAASASEAPAPPDPRPLEQAVSTLRSSVSRWQAAQQAAPPDFDADTPAAPPAAPAPASDDADLQRRLNRLSKPTPPTS